MFNLLFISALLFIFTGGLIGFLVACLIVAVVIYVVKLLLDLFGFPPTVNKIILLILGLIALVYLLSRLGVAI